MLLFIYWMFSVRDAAAVSNVSLSAQPARQSSLELVWCGERSVVKEESHEARCKAFQ